MENRKAKSPYRKYGKQPYKYTFNKCGHGRTETSIINLPFGDRYVETWRFVSCAGCGRIESRTHIR